MNYAVMEKLLSEQEENIINTLSRWFKCLSTHYDTIVASIVIPFEEKNGSVTELSAGQAFNRMMGDPDKEVRQRLFTAPGRKLEWQSFNFGRHPKSLDGFRLSDYKLHGTTDYLENPLNYNRMSQETLTVMGNHPKKINNHSSISNAQSAIIRQRKMDWQDQDAPIILGDLEEKRIPLIKPLPLF